MHQGCLHWGFRVIILGPRRKGIFRMIHEGHMGVVKMKAMARRNVWRPGIDSFIEECAKKLSGCMDYSNTAPQAPSLGISNQTLAENSCGLCRPILGISVSNCGRCAFEDVVSKLPEVLKINRTIHHKHCFFAGNGLPEHLIVCCYLVAYISLKQPKDNV